MEKEIKNKVIGILKNDIVTKIESQIVKEKKCSIYKEDLPLIVSFLVDEINQSELSIEELEMFINRNSDKIIAFAKRFLDGQSPKSLSHGIAISYAIYLIYLERKNDQLLESYIKRRRIPNPEKFLFHLKKVKKGID